MNPYISYAGGYLTNPNSTSACKFCSFRTTDEYLDLSFNIKYSNRWRDVGIVIAFIAFNVGVPVFPACEARGLTWLVFAGRRDILLYVPVPHEAVGRIEAVQMAEEVDSRTSTSASTSTHP